MEKPTLFANCIYRFERYPFTYDIVIVPTDEKSRLWT